MIDAQQNNISTPPKPAKTGVQSVERAFTLLGLIADAGGQATLSELAERADLPMPTIHRLLRTLVNLGCARQLQDRGYALGPTLMRLGELAGRQIGDIVRPHLQKLVGELGETANIAVLDGDMMVYAAQVPSAHSMRMFTEVGRRVHPSATGVGKAVLPSIEESRVAQIIHSSGMPQLTEKSITDFGELKAELERIRERGYAIDEEEQELGVRCFAVNVDGAPTPMAVSVSGPTSRLDEEFAAQAVPLLQAAARDISADLNRVEL
ncbi:MAG TPA: IclR family transcriptional regulator [Yaniella sp.]